VNELAAPEVPIFSFEYEVPEIPELMDLASLLSDRSFGGLCDTSWDARSELRLPRDLPDMLIRLFVDAGVTECGGQLSAREGSTLSIKLELPSTKKLSPLDRRAARRPSDACRQTFK
jgi:hypothetical protein